MSPTRKARAARSLAICMWALLNIAAMGQSASSLSLTLTPGRSEYLPLLPVVLTITLRNDSDATSSADAPVLGLDGPVGTDTPRYRFLVRRPDGTQIDAYHGDRVLMQPDLAPPHGILGKAVVGPRRMQILDYCAACGILQLPSTPADLRKIEKTAVGVYSTLGEYQIRLMLFGSNGSRLESNLVRIVVKPPDKAPDVLAYDILKRSSWPEMFLLPLDGDPSVGGIRPFPTEKIRDSTTSSPMETAREILTRCPDSEYAPYARQVLGTALCTWWGGMWVPRGGQLPDAAQQAEGIRLLRQSAEDLNLPRRFREEALLNLVESAERVSAVLQGDSKDCSQSLASILRGAKIPPNPFSPGEVFAIAKQIADHAPPPIFGQDWFEKVFTREQQEALQAAVTGNPAIAQGAGVSPVQAEMRADAAWARSELRKIPWRDPNTGQLTMTGVPLGVK
jgi:hypothetical protein